MNHQRKIIYERRQKMLRADKNEIEELLKQILEKREDQEKSGKIIEEKKIKLGDVNFLETVRRIALYTTDTLWMEHLEAMDYLRSSVNLRAYGQREPIVEYKKDGLAMFKEMEEVFKEQVFSLITTINTEAVAKMETQTSSAKEVLITSHSEPSEDAKSAQTDPVVQGSASHSGMKEIGRNDPCPCGAINPATGEIYKWKKCGMINAPQHRKALVNG